MNDPFGKSGQALTDALLQLDNTISLAESNVAAALQLGLPEAADMASRLPALTLRAREFLASVPTAAQAPRWGENRRLLDQAAAFQPLFSPYVMLGKRVAAAKQAVADRVAREKAIAEEARRAHLTFECNASLETARRRYSSVRQALAEMQLQRGPGYDDAAWQSALRSVSSILGAQDVRIASAAASIRDRAFEDARSMLDQSLGELQAALDLANRARGSAAARARLAVPSSPEPTVPMPGLSGAQTTPPLPRPADGAGPAAIPQRQAAPAPEIRSLSLIEVRNGTVFRCDGRPTLVGRGLDAPSASGALYINLSQACDPGEAEELGVSRRHAEIARQSTGIFALRDLGSTNGTRQKRFGQSGWATLAPQQWTPLQEGDTLQFGLLEVKVALTTS
jgi:pSer/pThr/pTyr-binding forkhead associated (FHA) protein